MQLDNPVRIEDSTHRRFGAVALDDVIGQPSFLASDMAKTTQTEILGSTDLMFRAFSDRTRLRILHVLHGGELCVGDIVEILQAPQPRISRHLAYLRKANLVMVRKSGLWSHYSLAPAKTAFHRKLLECLAKCFSEVPELQADSARAVKIRKSGGCCPKS
jgi:ArsR family transcriptional regulator